MGKKYIDIEDDYIEEQDNNQKSHFNTLKFTKALKLINSNPEGARKAFEEYLEKYPADYWAHSVYASILITLKEFELAEIVLNNVEEKLFVDGHLANDIFRRHNDEKNIFFSRIRLLSYTERYEELYNYLNENEEFITQFHLKELYLYCKKKLGILNEERIPNFYLSRQVIKYEEQDMMHHIIYHTADYNLERDVPKTNVFSAEFPIYEIINEVRKYIPSEKKLCTGVLADWYYFKYDECGKENQRNTNYFKVVCFHNTKDIISVCPVKEGDNLPHVDLNYLKKEEKPKTKQISRIERFNQRYKRNL